MNFSILFPKLHEIIKFIIDVVITARHKVSRARTIVEMLGHLLIFHSHLIHQLSHIYEEISFVEKYQSKHQIFYYLLTNWYHFVTINSNTETFKSFKSPATASHFIHNHPFFDIISQIWFYKVVRINSSLNINKPKPADSKLNRTNRQWRLSIDYRKHTLKAYPTKIWPQYKVVSKNLQRLRHNFLRIKIMVIIQKFGKDDAIFLQFFVKIFSFSLYSVRSLSPCW